MIICDTSGVLAAVDASQRFHRAARAVIEAESGPFVLSPFVLAELDYLLATRVGMDAELGLLREVARGAYRLESFRATDIEVVNEIIAKYHDSAIGLADASVVLLANRYRTNRILTLDERHFRSIRPEHGKAFTLLPVDA